MRFHFGESVNDVSIFSFIKNLFYIGYDGVVSCISPCSGICVVAYFNYAIIGAFRVIMNIYWGMRVLECDSFMDGEGLASVNGLFSWDP